MKYLVQKEKKLEIIESESEDSSDSNVSEEEDSSEWEDVTESTEIPERVQFRSGKKSAGPHVSANITEPLDFFKLFYTDQLIDTVVTETNKYAHNKLKDKELSKKSMWINWKETTTQEFCAFLAVILNMGTMPLANIAQYWSTDENSRIPFYPNVFTRDRFT